MTDNDNKGDMEPVSDDWDGLLNIPTTAESLDKACKEAKFPDASMVLDVYLLVNNKGNTSFIPDEELLEDLEKADPQYWKKKTRIANRKDFLESMAKSNYMQQLIQLNDPMKAVLQFLDDMKKAIAARRQCLKKATPIEAENQNAHSYGYYGEKELDVLANEFQLAYDEATESFDEYLQSLTSPIEVCDSDAMGSYMSGCGFGRYFNASEAPGVNLAKSVVKHAKDLPITYPLLFKEFSRLAEELGAGNMEDVDADQDTDRKREDLMTDYSQVDTVDPLEMARENFDQNLASKKLEVQHSQDEEEGNCHLYVLLDLSGSMRCCDIGGRVSRAWVANVITLALLTFAAKDKWVVHIVPFTGGVGDMKSAKDRQTALDTMKWLGEQQYDGGSTDIERAVLYAYKDLQSDPEYRKCDVVLITDGCSPISDKIVDDKPERCKLRTLFVSDELPYGGHSNRIIKASDTNKLVGFDNMTAQITLGDALSKISDRSSNDVPIELDGSGGAGAKTPDQIAEDMLGGGSWSPSWDDDDDEGEEWKKGGN